MIKKKKGKKEGKNVRDTVPAALPNLKDLLFSVLSSATSVLSRTASDGVDRRMREVAGTPREVLGEPSLRPSKHCLTGSYSISSCRVWLVQ